MNRRAICIGIALASLSTASSARGMYCTRHPDACRIRREQEAVWAQAEAKRRALLTPEQRQAEDDQHEAERRAMQAKWDREERERKEREAASENAVLMAFLFIGAASALCASAVIWFVTSGGAKK